MVSGKSGSRCLSFSLCKTLWTAFLTTVRLSERPAPGTVAPRSAGEDGEPRRPRSPAGAPQPGHAGGQPGAVPNAEHSRTVRPAVALPGIYPDERKTSVHTQPRPRTFAARSCRAWEAAGCPPAGDTLYPAAQRHSALGGDGLASRARGRRGARLSERPGRKGRVARGAAEEAKPWGRRSAAAGGGGREVTLRAGDAPRGTPVTGTIVTPSSKPAERTTPREKPPPQAGRGLRVTRWAGAGSSLHTRKVPAWRARQRPGGCAPGRQGPEGTQGRGANLTLLQKNRVFKNKVSLANPPPPNSLTLIAGVGIK